MKAEIISHTNLEYLKIPLLQVTQKEHSFYLAKIKAYNFLKIYTVRPAQYDLEKHKSLANSFTEDDKYYAHLITEDKAKIKEKDFQREPNDGRISEIVKFIKDEEYAFFPNTIIANCELINDWETFDIDEDSSEADFFSVSEKPSFLSFLKKEMEDSWTLYVPNLTNSVLVIDGQHRLVGLSKVDDEIQKNYDLIVTFMVGFDRSIIAKQFYTINYEQKPVNKSLLYQLTGEFTREINELSFMHNVVKLLNELDQSPFQGRVKMLGKNPKNATTEEKAKLSISQAFLIDSTIRFISEKARGSSYPPIFLKYFKNPEEHIVIVRTLARFFNAVKELKPDWDMPSESIISKGMGVAALLKTLNLLFPVFFKKKLNDKWEDLANLTVNDFKEFLSGIENVNFGTNGPHGKTGSAGSISKIKDDILHNLKYIEYPDNIPSFEKDYMKEYLLNLENKLTKL